MFFESGPLELGWVIYASTMWGIAVLGITGAAAQMAYNWINRPNRT